MAMLRISYLLLLFQATQAWKFMEKLKAPTLKSFGNFQKGNKFGEKKLVVITGTSSGLGKAATKALLRSKKYHVVGAVRDLAKMDVVAEAEGFDPEDFTPMYLDLASFESVSNFVEELDKFRGNRPIDRLACNAAVYQPTLNYPKYTVDGHEQQLQINYLGHFLLTSKVMPMMLESDDPRVCMIGSVTGNDNTVGGGGVYPIADLKELEGLELGCKKPIAMMDGYNFNGAKAYKDTKLALMMTSNMLHERYHRSTDVAFSSIYPGCIAESPLFREKRAWFRKYFPIFMKYITGGFVGEEEAGQRLFQVLHDPRCRKSGVYWSWNGGAREGRGMEAMEKGGQIVGAGGAGGGWDSIFENDQSDKVLDKDMMMKLWQCTTEITKAEWPAAYQPKSPCPTLKAVGAATSVLGRLEESARMKASRQGALAQVLGNTSLPKEQRRQAMEEMLAALDKTPEDALQRQRDELRTSGLAPATIAVELAKLDLAAEAAAPVEKKKSSRLGWLANRLGLGRKAKPIEAIKPKDVTEEDLKRLYQNDNLKLAVEAANASASQANVVSLQVPDLDDPVIEEKEPPKMIPGHELLGDVPVVFQPKNIMTKARVGAPLSEVAAQADVFIRYKCKKGECKTCVVNIDGKWVSACTAKIPPVSPGETFSVYARPVSEAHKYAEKAAFFSPKSIADGALNNALGMVGFAKDGLAADPDFQIRMERERAVQEVVAKRKAKMQMSQSKLERANNRAEYLFPGLLVVVSFMLTLVMVRSLQTPAHGMQEPLFHS